MTVPSLTLLWQPIYGTMASTALIWKAVALASRVSCPLKRCLPSSLPAAVMGSILPCLSPSLPNSLMPTWSLEIFLAVNLDSPSSPHYGQAWHSASLHSRDYGHRERSTQIHQMVCSFNQFEAGLYQSSGPSLHHPQSQQL